MKLRTQNLPTWAWQLPACAAEAATR